MRNGNVPIALQRWEYLGRDNDMLRLGTLGGQAGTVPRQERCCEGTTRYCTNPGGAYT